MGITLKGGLAHGFSFAFGDERIKLSEKNKYLGIIIDTDMKYKNQVQHIIQKESNEFSRMEGMIRRDWGIDYNAAFLIYKSVYIPCITYGASVWMMD